MKLLFVFGLLFFCPFVNAQEVTNEAVNPVDTTDAPSTAPRIWLQAGPGFSTLEVEASRNETQARTGLMAAVELEFPMNPDFSVQAGLDYAQKGIRSSITDTVVALDYLQIPVVGKAKFNAWTNSELVLMAGPYAAFAVGRKLSSGNRSIDETGSVRDFDIGARFGAALETKLSSNLLFSAGLSYETGFLNLSKNSLDGTARNQSLIALLALGVVL